MRNRLHALAWLVLVLLAALPLLPAASGPADTDFLVLLTNDDGYTSPGLRSMVEAFASEFHVVVAAPADQQSGVSGAITYRDPIFVRELNIFDGVKAYSLTATPATCARVGIEALAGRKPDLVISGINSSENLGSAIPISGTVGAARQAASVGVPAIAVSRGRDADYDDVAAVALRLVRRLRDDGSIEPGLLLNLNVPGGELKGIRVVRQSMALDKENYERRVNPRRQVYYWSNWTPPIDNDTATDIGAFAAGYATVTPLVVDQTDQGAMVGFGGLEELSLAPMKGD